MGRESFDGLPRPGDPFEDVDGVAAGRAEDDLLVLEGERHHAPWPDSQGVPEDLGDDDLALRPNPHPDLDHVTDRV